MDARLKEIKCMFCRKADKHDHGWEECSKCGAWAHTKCASVDEESEEEWICPKCADSDILLKVPGKVTKKSGANSDSGTVPGAGSSAVPTEEELAEEQRVEREAFAKQMELRKKRLAEKLAWSEQRMKEEAEMQALEMKTQREIEKKQLAHDQKLLERQLAAEKEFLKKKATVKKQIEASKAKVNALKAEESSKKKVTDWLKSGEKPGSGKTPKPKPEVTPESSSDSHDSESDGEKSVSGKGSVKPTSKKNGGSVYSAARITREQMAARKVLGHALPKFRGEPEVWPLFISCFEQTTAACGFTNLENLSRLVEALEGEALENVRGSLVFPSAVPDIIQDLRDMFGRPEKLLKALLAKVKQAPAPRADRLGTFISFGMVVKQLCDHLEAANLHDHLNNPMIVQELVEKLPPSYQMDWVRFKRGRKESPLRRFTNFMKEIVNDAAEVAEFSSLNLSDQSKMGSGRAHNKEFVHVHGSEQKRVEAARAEKPSKPCWICKRTDHFMRSCEQFKRMNVAQRLREVGKLNLCHRCLNKHGSSPCNSRVRCTVPNCVGNHHPLLHRAEESVQLQKAESTGRSVIFRMMPVTLYAGKRQFDTVAFLDEGSSATLMDDAVAKQLKAEGVSEPLIVTWTGNINRIEDGSRKVDLMLSARGSTEKFPLMNTRTVGKLLLPEQNVNYGEVVKKYSHLSGVPLQDLPSGVPTILIGLDNLHLFAPLESRVGKSCEPIAVRSKVGWTVYGAEKRRASTHAFLNLHSVAPVTNQQLHDMLKEQYMIDDQAPSAFPIPEPVEETRAREILLTTTKRVGERFETGLLWREDERKFPDSYPMAVRRMKALDRKLEKNPELRENVCQQIEDYQTKGYAHKITDAELSETPNEAAWYLPLNVVVNPRKKKVRLVWDAAATVNGTSLNTELLKGPDMLVPLLRVINHFRERPIAIGGDIQEMYHQIRIRPEDKQAQRFLFRTSATEKPEIYVMDVATFGATSSPCSAQFVKNLNADQCAEKFPEAAAAIIKRHYVDDYYDSVDTVEQAVQRAKEVKEVHSRGGFNIRNWVSNSATVLKALGEKSVDFTVDFNRDKGPEYERVLGIVWDPAEDVFSFTTMTKSEYAKVLSGETRPTKRIVLSIVMSQFDPAGFLGPVTIRGKMLIQDLWRTGCQWDEFIDELSFKMWLRWTSILLDAQTFRLPRSYFGNARSDEIKEIQLHIFADAGEKAYGCVGYFRAIVRSEVECAFVMSRSKVAPLQLTAVPRLELNGSGLAARMSQTIHENHNFTITKTFFWIDSAVVLSWIRSDQRRYKQYVGFRIGEILSLTNIDDWNFVSTRVNIADILTKWSTDLDLSPSSPWVRCPRFVYDDQKDWPKKALPPPNTTVELRIHLLLHDVQVVESLVDVSRFSRWTVLVRTMATVCRFVSNLKRKVKGLPVEKLQATRNQEKLLGSPAGSSVRVPLQQNEYERAEQYLMRMAQTEDYIDEMKVLTRNKNRPTNQWIALEKSSPLYQLTPLVDENGLIRMEGRLEQAEFLPFDMRFPVILPKNNRITELIVQDYHERCGHGYRQSVKNKLRQLYYIPKVDAVVRRIESACVWCEAHRKRPTIPRMASLPVQRLTPYLRPFSYVGVDYLGPFDVSVGRRSEKRWIALFTCMATRAVHLEVAHGLTTQSCLMAIHRFIGRRGWPSEFLSDNGTNFQGASKELTKDVRDISEHCADQLTNARTKWSFNPPLAPHMGGVWERLVRSVKEALTALDDGRRLTDEILQTAIVEAEDMINSRPLTYVSQQSDEAEAITPNHFLRGASPNQPGGALPSPNPAVALRDTYQRSQQLASVMWERWINEYLPTLNRRTKWFGETRPLESGDLVYIVEGNNRKSWIRGIVEEPIVGKDGRVRQAWVRTNSGRYKRAVAKLAVLEVREGNPQPEADSRTGLRAGECSDNTATKST
ncbi:uncharacterized protein LOC120420555 [Culex pipiens pallens]|uniref:uncharacterized protein LOC120420555 n=1 Tax=Culex pipiens pallens TaxID=42434 RepID=UPI001953D149|nr:uncharacterized protein LOC120420555 [Culex pipiens pallens]XP_052564453.1 uncharacterized protein LOC120420555 [Culex pipiens pallens]